jgi:ferredoxin
VKVTVDQDICQGHARCAVIAPELFVLDDMGHSQEVGGEVPKELEAAAERAATNCPEGAIKLS